MLLKTAITLQAEIAEEPPPLVSLFSRYSHARGYMRRAVLQIMAAHPKGIHYLKVHQELLAQGFNPISQQSTTRCVYNLYTAGDVQRVSAGVFKVTTP